MIICIGAAKINSTTVLRILGTQIGKHLRLAGSAQERKLQRYRSSPRCGKSGTISFKKSYEIIIEAKWKCKRPS